MVTLNELMGKAQAMKEDVYGDKPSYMKPRDIHPHMRSWIVSLLLVIWAVVAVDTVFQSVLVASVWLVTQWSFFHAKVAL